MAGVVAGVRVGVGISVGVWIEVGRGKLVSWDVARVRGLGRGWDDEGARGDGQAVGNREVEGGAEVGDLW